MLPPGFMLGASTAAPQVEGAAAEDGRGASIWDVFAARPGAVLDGSNGAVAADHYHRLDEDVALLGTLGAGYRFSISWSRVLPAGGGRPNPAGLDFYDRLLDRLLEAGVEPMAVLYQSDLPQALEDDGGWLNRATVDRFAEYAALVGERYADRVAHWVPLGEPNVGAIGGYVIGRVAPGRALNFDGVAAVHHQLLAHGRAAVALREAGASSVGCANQHAPIWPASEDVADVAASKLFDAAWNGMFLEPMLLGRYPVDIAPLVEDWVRPGDLATVRQPLDFYGVTYYSPLRVAVTDDEDAELPFEFRELLGYPRTGAGLAIVPDALREWLIMFRARFRAALPPLVVVGSGCSYEEAPGPGGRVDDAERIAFLEQHLQAVAEAVQRGVDVRGFYVASLLDGFDLSFGRRFGSGLVRVDPDTLDRTPKASFDWLAEVIAAQPTSLG